MEETTCTCRLVPPACILSDSETSIGGLNEPSRAVDQPRNPCTEVVIYTVHVLVKINLCNNSVVAIGDMKVQRGQPIPKIV